MKKGFGIALITIGIIMVIYGINASESATSGVSRAFTGAPTNKTLWLLLGGIGSGIVGLAIMFRPSGRA